MQRIGEFKSAGDQLLRRDMAEPQRLQLDEIVGSVYDSFLTEVAASRKKSREVGGALAAGGCGCAMG